MYKLEALTLLIPFLTEKEYNRLKNKILKEASGKTPSVGKNEAKIKQCQLGYCINKPYELARPRCELCKHYK